MNRLLAGTALSLWTTLIPYCAFAAEATTEYRVPAIELPSFTVTEAQPRNRYLRPLLYTLQAFDAFNTAAALHKGRGRHETNAMMRPFSHGGAPTMMLGFALGDIARDHFFRRASAQRRDSIDAVQAMSNIDGIIMTSKSLQQP